MRTSDLSGAALDYAVAKAEGIVESFFLQFYEGDVEVNEPPEFHYSTDWALGGPIIEREKIALHFDGDSPWVAECGWNRCNGATPLIAAMRYYVLSKLGDEVQIPEGL